VVADLSGIELRVNHFLWKVPSSMELFQQDRENADLYKDFASTLYEVDDKNVKVGYDGKGYLILDCDCKHQGIKSKHFPLCSHKLAALFYLEHEHMKKM